MKPFTKRLFTIGGGFLSILIGAFFILYTLQSNINFFKKPSEITEKDTKFRLGGQVKSWEKSTDGLTHQFIVTDETGATINAIYTGIMPELFRVDQGVVADGTLQNGMFIADKIMTKHDENYKPYGE